MQFYSLTCSKRKRKFQLFRTIIYQILFYLRFLMRRQMTATSYRTIFKRPLIWNISQRNRQKLFYLRELLFVGIDKVGFGVIVYLAKRFANII